MKIEVTLMCGCGTELDEIAEVVCTKQVEHAVVGPHRHGKCPACDSPMICVRERATVPEHHTGNA
jgi:hypothetical protein